MNYNTWSIPSHRRIMCWSTNMFRLERSHKNERTLDLIISRLSIKRDKKAICVPILLQHAYKDISRTAYRPGKHVSVFFPRIVSTIIRLSFLPTFSLPFARSLEQYKLDCASQSGLWKIVKIKCQVSVTLVDYDASTAIATGTAVIFYASVTLDL